MTARDAQQLIHERLSDSDLLEVLDSYELPATHTPSWHRHEAFDHYADQRNENPT